MNKLNLTPEMIARQALVQYGKSSLLDALANARYEGEKRWKCENVLKTKSVNQYVHVNVRIETIEDVLKFVAAVAEVTANTEEHAAFSNIGVSAYEDELSYYKVNKRPATEEELKAAEDWLAANKQEALQPIKWRQFVPINQYVKVIDNNGDVNND